MTYFANRGNFCFPLEFIDKVAPPNLRIAFLQEEEHGEPWQHG